MSERGDGPEGPRAHHHSFAHRVLPGLFFDNPVTLVCLLGAGRALQMLETVWRDLGEDLPPGDRLPARGLAVTGRTFPDGVVVVCTLPPPLRTGEARFVAAAIGSRRGGMDAPAHEAPTPGAGALPGAGVAVRVFALEWREPAGPRESGPRRREIALAPGPGEPHAIFWERTRGGAWRNLGALAAPSADAFARAAAAASWGSRG